MVVNDKRSAIEFVKSWIDQREDDRRRLGVTQLRPLGDLVVKFERHANEQRGMAAHFRSRGDYQTARGHDEAVGVLLDAVQDVGHIPGGSLR